MTPEFYRHYLRMEGKKVLENWDFRRPRPSETTPLLCFSPWSALTVLSHPPTHPDINMHALIHILHAQYADIQIRVYTSTPTPTHAEDAVVDSQPQQVPDSEISRRGERQEGQQGTEVGRYPVARACRHTHRLPAFCSDLWAERYARGVYCICRVSLCLARGSI